MAQSPATSRVRLGQPKSSLTLYGGAAINGTGNGLANTIAGNDAANVLNGGAGADTLIGGAGINGFFFNTALGANNVDDILDFYVPNDTIYLASYVFTRVGANGRLSASAFHKGSAAADSADRILYYQVNGNQQLCQRRQRQRPGRRRRRQRHGLRPYRQ